MSSSRADDFLEPDQAFKLVARSTADGAVIVQFVVAPGYYLYRHPFRFAAGGRQLEPVMPAGVRKFDENFQKEVETYRGRLVVHLRDVAEIQQLEVTAQGCADQGLCYAPATVVLVRHGSEDWSLQSADSMPPMLGAAVWADSPASGPSPASKPSIHAEFQHLFRMGLRFWTTPVPWALFGLLTALLTSSGAVRTRRCSGVASLAFTGGWAATWGTLGACTALTGATDVAWLQTPSATVLAWLTLGLAAGTAAAVLRRTGVVGRADSSTTGPACVSSVIVALLAGALSPFALGAVVAPMVVSALQAIEPARGPLVGATGMVVMALGAALPWVMAAPAAARWLAMRRQSRTLATALWVCAFLAAAGGLLQARIV